MPIYNTSDSVRQMAYGMEMVWRDTSGSRREDTARLCGPHGQARPFPVKTVKLLSAPKQKALPFGEKYEIEPASSSPLVREVSVLSVLPRPVADLFVTVAEGNIYMDDRVQWFRDETRSERAAKMVCGAQEFRDNERFQQAAENSAVAAGMMLSSVIDGGEESAPDRMIFAEAWSVLTSILDEDAFMDLVGQIRNTPDWELANSKWAKSKEFWKRAFPQKRPNFIGRLVSAGDERVDADKARCLAAFEQRIRDIAVKDRILVEKRCQIAAHRAKMAALRQEVRELTRMAR